MHTYRFTHVELFHVNAQWRAPQIPFTRLSRQTGTRGTRIRQ